MKPKLDEIDTPAVLIDLDIVKRNLARAQSHISSRNMAMRPHIKTHKLPHFAKMQVALGAVGITCQKLSEAEVMADNGLGDILITYNIIGAGKLTRLRALADRIKLSVCADNAPVIAGLGAAMAGSQTPLPVLIEIDTGVQRCGVETPEQALVLAQRIAASDGLHFQGLMTYPPAGGRDATETLLKDVRDHLAGAGNACETISTGGTPDIWEAGVSIATEYRPGTYIYNDIMQVQAKSASLQDCALSVLTTVVSRPGADRAVLDAGSKTLSSDPCSAPGFGHISAFPDAVITHMNEEHGMVDLRHCDPQARPDIGDRIRIIPNHACVVSNLFDSVVLVENGRISDTVPVAARGCLT